MFTKASFLIPVVFALSGCNSGWIEPLAERPENLKIAVLTISLNEHADSAPLITQADAEKMVLRASRIWEKNCGISLVLKAHLQRNADEAGLPFKPDGTGEVTRVQEAFFSENYLSVVLVQDFKSPQTSVYTAGMAPYPWDPRHSIIMDAAAASDAVLPHEFGHYLGLKHTDIDDWDETGAEDPHNLMFTTDIGYKDDRVMIGLQCAEAKRYLLGYDTLRPLCRPDAPDAAQNCPDPAPVK